MTSQSTQRRSGGVDYYMEHLKKPLKTEGCIRMGITTF
jgi:hypothetical protein